MKTIPSLITVAILAVSSTACILMRPGMLRSADRTAANPLVSGKPLEAKHKGDVGVVPRHFLRQFVAFGGKILQHARTRRPGTGLGLLCAR